MMMMLCTYIVFKAEQFEINAGIWPVRWFLFSLSCFRETAPPISEGSVPLRRLLLRSRTSASFSPPMPLGTEPKRELAEIFRCTKLVRIQTLDGISPENRLEERSRMRRPWRNPTLERKVSFPDLFWRSNLELL